MPSNARQAVVELLDRWRLPQSPPLVPEREAAFWSAFTVRDRAFVFDLLHGVIRWRGTLDHLIQAATHRPLDQLQRPLRAILEVGVFQLLLQEGAADYAAIDTCVEMVRRTGPANAGGLVNAVLRRIQRLRVGCEPRQAPRGDAFPLDWQRQMRLRESVFPDPLRDFSAWAAAATSHPKPLVAALSNWLGVEGVLPVLIADNSRPLIMLRRDDPHDTPSPECGIIPHTQTGYFVAADGWNDSLAQAVRRGGLSPQDPTAGLAVRELLSVWRDHSVNPSGEMKILDLCAGLGTKTIQLARVFSAAQIVAADVALEKLKRLESRYRQLNLANILVRPAGEIGPHRLTERFDVVLVDAPCSNTGVLARRVQARWRWPMLDRKALAEQQLTLLHQAAAVLAPRGILLYSTCSIDPAENQELLAHFLATAPRDEWRIIRETTLLPQDTGDPGRRHDGGFVGALRRNNRLASGSAGVP